MLPENITAIVARNEAWSDAASSEPYEAGWAREAVIFVRALKTPEGPQPPASVEISPDGMHWVAEGTMLTMPSSKNQVVAARVRHIGNWLRVSARFDAGAQCTELVTLHLKA